MSFRKVEHIRPAELSATGFKFWSPQLCPTCRSSDVIFNRQGTANPFGRLWSCLRCGQAFILLPAAPSSHALPGLEPHKHV